jgi:hypothetical protein
MKAIYVVKRHPKPTPFIRYQCVDRRTGDVLGEYKRKDNAKASADFANSIEAKYGSTR